MKSHNTMSHADYILKNLIWGNFACYLYYKIFLTRLQMPISGKILNLNDSLWFLIVTYALLMVLGIVTTVKTHRNMRNVQCNVFLSLGLTCAIMTYRIRPVITAIIFVLCFGLILIYAFRVLIRKIPLGKERKTILKRRLKSILHKSRGFSFSAVICCVVVFCSILIFGTGAVETPKVQPDNKIIMTHNSLIKTNIDILKQINDPYWSELGVKEKLDILQYVINTEATYFGLPEAPSLKTDILKPNVLGSYSHETKTISISKEHLNSPARECLITILHECYHSYQHYLCESFADICIEYKDLRLFAIIQDYEANFADYQKEGEAYYSQVVEIMAESYANSSVDEYFEKIVNFQENY